MNLPEYLAADSRAVGAIEHHLRGIAEEATMAQRPRQHLFTALDALDRAKDALEEAVILIDPENAPDLLEWEVPQEAKAVQTGPVNMAAESEPTETFKTAAGLDTLRSEAPPIYSSEAAWIRFRALELAIAKGGTSDAVSRNAKNFLKFVTGKEE